jgi:hypothetical protein
MEYAFVFAVLIVIPAAIWLGSWVAQERGRRYHGRPPSTEGGEPTIYRRAPEEDSTPSAT